MISLKCNNFGPIVSGAVDLKPLTIFVGPNNSGKSYLSMLTYALFHGGPLGTNLGIRYNFYRRGRRGLLRDFFPFFGPTPPGIDDAMPQLARWLVRNHEKVSDSEYLNIGDLPVRAIQALNRGTRQWIDLFVDSIETELPRCFGSEISSLPNSSAAKSSFGISLEHLNPPWQLSFNSVDADIEAKKISVSLKDQRLEIGEVIRSMLNTSPNRIPVEELEFRLSETVSQQLFFGMYNDFPASTYYLPAARSGILHSHKLLASMIVSRAPLAGIEPLQIARLSGVVADFIGGLITLDSDSETGLIDVAEFLEQDVAKGRVFLESSQVEYPEIYYESKHQRFLLHQTSSMVSELAPLILYLKHRVEPGDLLIIEEPESHLHPANQRLLAWAIVKLIRRGLRIAITTHSDFFLTQLSNFVRLSELPRERTRQGYGKEDFLSPEDVGCYLFSWNDKRGGSTVRPLNVDSDTGISEDELSDVAESLYNEFVDLERALLS